MEQPMRALVTPFAPAVVAVALLAQVQGVQANDCQTIYEAYEALSKAPAYRQTMAFAGVPPMELIVIGDAIYMKPGPNWQKLPVDPGTRASMQKQTMPSAAALKDCSRVGTETVRGQPATIYQYTPPPMEGAGPLGPQRVWIGTTSGLPLRMTSQQETTDVNLFYENVVAPIP